VKLKNVHYAGSHGMDISTPQGSSKYQDKKHQQKAVDEKVYIYTISPPPVWAQFLLTRFSLMFKTG
jgi:hypothetical protein